jgi:hypothetical protein
MTSKIDDLIVLDSQGFFPAPNEEREAFLTRVSALQKFKQDVQKEITDTGKFQLEGLVYHKEEVVSEKDLYACQNQSKDKYQFQLNYVPAFFSSKGLNFLFGGMAMTFEDTENKYKKGEMFSIFQLRKCFRDKEKFLIYTRNEIISHECCHVARAPFKALEYEEFFAYQTSDSAFRRIVSPMLWRGSDMVVLMLLLMVVFIAQVYVTFFSHDYLFYIYGWAPFFAFLSFLSLRSFSSRKAFSRLKSKMTLLCKEPSLVDAILFRMTDQEIREAIQSKSLADYLSTKKDLRWQIIRKRFFAH